MADSELVIVCLINLDMINIATKSFKLVLNEIKHTEIKNSFIIIIIRRLVMRRSQVISAGRVDPRVDKINN